MKSTYKKLSQVDSRNDSQVIFYDQVIPGGVLLGYLNADYWAIAVPFNRTRSLLSSTFIDKNAFPREVLVFGDRPAFLEGIDFFDWERFADYR